MSETHKICSKCRQKFPLSEFHKDSKRSDGLNPWCKNCVKEYQLSRRDELNKYQRNYREQNKDIIKDKARKRFEELRAKTLKHLESAPKCKKCEITDIRVLCIDHIDNDGALERKSVNTMKIYKSILSMPKDEAIKKYQILCRNCNWIKMIEWKNKNE